MSKCIDAQESLKADCLRDLIAEALEKQGFHFVDDSFHLPDGYNKEQIRLLHAEAVNHLIARRKRGLYRHEPALLNRIATGSEIVPNQIDPQLVEVHPNTQDELLFRYASLHWSIPVSSGYGRRLRFLIIDRSNEKLIGLFGLGDPVFSIRDRDEWIGWDFEDRRKRLHHVLDAYVLGAVPPYSFLLCGKLVALLTVSNEVREAFRRKYEGRSSLIQRRKLNGHIALITTTSALGRSSLYNRLRFEDRLAFERIGNTKGYGEFQFSNGLYNTLVKFAKENSDATAKHRLWGRGFRNRREVVQKTLSALGVPENWRKHGINREIYASPLAKNTLDFLAGNDATLNYFDQPADELYNWFRNRWLIPRSERDQRYTEWDRSEWVLWPSGDELS